MNTYVRKDCSKDSYDDMLDESGAIDIGYLSFYPSDILKNCDPIAYDCGYSEYEDSCEDIYICGGCDTEYDDEEDADHCCMYECDNCGEWYKDEDDAKSCCQEEEEDDD